MTCTKCKKEHICFVLREFREVAKRTYPWWEPSRDAITDFVYGHCTQFELNNSEVEIS